jgi:hypothetical protein
MYPQQQLSKEEKFPLIQYVTLASSQQAKD